jgi:Fe-S-cluster containining protein
MKKTCTCEKCVNACQVFPGWMAPIDATRAIKADHARSLMRDWLEPSSEVGNEERIYVLAAAAEGFGGRDAPELEEMQGWTPGIPTFLFGFLGGASLPTKGPCVFLKRDRCSIHDSGFKPKQCREAFGCDTERGPDNFAMARLWDTEAGKLALAAWIEALARKECAA